MEILSTQLWRVAGATICILVIAAEASAGICLRVDLTFDGRDLSPVTIQSMQSEASAIWQPYGVQIQWPGSHDVSCSRVHGTFDVFVQDQGASAATASGSSVLGSTHLAQAAIDDVAIFIDYDETLRQLESLSAARLIPLAGHPDIGSADIGRALGRVLAHEIGHVLLDAPRHQPWGLMRRAFRPEDLAARQRWSYTLSKKEVERLASRERELTER